MKSIVKLAHLLADGHYHSGEILGQQLGMSRAGVWKLIHRLETEYGLNLYSVRGKGYRLSEPLELLDKESIISQLPSTVAEQMARLEVLFDTASTNDEINKKNPPGNIQPWVVVAERQFSGKGRRGRRWVSPFGQNIYFSLFWHFDLAAAQLACLGLFISVAVTRVLRQLGIEDIGVKWPNDLYWHDRKLGGILLEMKGDSMGPCSVTIGIGLNVSMSPEAKEIKEIDQPWIDIETILGKRPERNQLVALLIKELYAVCHSIPASQEQLLDEWRSYDVLYNQDVDVIFTDKILKGQANGITDEGALVVTTDKGDINCFSGEVSVRRG